MMNKPIGTAKPLVSKRDPRPCPVCYAPMTNTKEGWACDKHGVPDRK